MPKFLVWSDLHKEFQGFDLPDPRQFGGPIDGVLIAGDTDTGQAEMYLRFGRQVWERYGVPVIMVLGNHEYYGCEIHHLHERERQVLAEMHDEGVELHVLHGETITIAGVRIAGATLWTDFHLDPARIHESRAYAESWMNDYRAIRIDDGGPRPLRTGDVLDMHYVDKAALWSILCKPHAGPTIVMSHHMPVAQAVHRNYLNHPLNAAFASDLMPEIRDLNFDVWIYGHSHENNEFDIATETGLKRFISNPRGYPGETTRFDPVRILEL